MRKLLYPYPDGLESLQPAPPPFPPPSWRRFPDFTFFFPSIPVARTAFDLTTLAFIAGLLLLSLLAFSFIFYMRVRSRRLHHLENFNSLWTVRLLLVTLASLWAVNEILRVPYVRRNYLFPFLPSLTPPQQSSICKIHVVLSLGLLEPGFLATLLFLVNVSIKKTTPSRLWALVSLLMISSPTTLLQMIFVYFSPLEGKLPHLTHGSSVEVNDLNGNRTALCTYPFFSFIIFGGFAVAYAVFFLLSCWWVLTFVINKRISDRINVLATSVMVGLSMQIVCLSMSRLWMPEDAAYGFEVLVMFLFVAGSMAVGEFILVLKPITDALAADSELRRRRQADGTPEGPR